jgi:Transcriptional regulator
MIRNQIIQAAYSLFTQKGIDSVDIKQVATVAGVSVEDLKAEFDGKLRLLEECLKQKVSVIETAISTAQSISQSALETLILVMYVSFKEKSALCNAFDKDLNRYPSIRKQLAIFNMKIQNRCVDYFTKCIKDGYFVPNENQERMAMIYMEEICNLAAKYQHAMIQTLIKGICTPKGLNEAARIQTVLEMNINKIGITK